MKQSSKFGFGSTRENLAHNVAQDVDSTVGFELGGGSGRGIGEIKVTGGARVGLDDGQIGRIAFDGKYHVTGGEAEGSIGVSGTIIQELREFIHCGFGALRLLSSKLANGGEERGINCACVEKEGAKNFENVSLVGHIKGGGVVGQMANCVLAP